MNQATVFEEAAHFAAATLEDFPVTELATGLLYNGHSHGYCNVIANDTARDEWKYGKVLLAPHVCTDKVPAWPPRPHAPTGDEGALAALVDNLDLDERAYKRLVSETRELVWRPAFKRLTFATMYAVTRFGPTLDERFLSHLAARFAMNPDVDTLDDEISEVLELERERQRERSRKSLERLGVTPQQLAVAAAQWRLQQHGRSDSVTASDVQPLPLSPRERRLDTLDSAESQRARAEQIAAELGYDG